jgi:hypothetical protein
VASLLGVEIAEGLHRAHAERDVEDVAVLEGPRARSEIEGRLGEKTDRSQLRVRCECRRRSRWS